MKRTSAALLLVLVLCASFCTAYALNLDIEIQTLPNLYDLEMQLYSQRQINDLSGSVEYRSSFTYDDFERNPGKHLDEKIRFTGTVEQVVEGTDYTVFRIAKDGNIDQMFYIEYVRSLTAPRILEDDEVIVYATFRELKTYKSTTNLSVTVPGCHADLIVGPIRKSAIKSSSNEEIDETLQKVREQIRKKSKVDSQGRYEINNGNYNDYARNERQHKSEEVTYSGTVLQVIESRSVCTLRIAINNKTDFVVYTIFSPDEEDVRILDGDKVVVTGLYNGLYTYSSTLGGDITIPSCLASDVLLASYNVPASFPKDNGGNAYINKQTFDDFSRRPQAHQGEKVRFEGRVLQVIEGKNETQYRVAVGNDTNNAIFVILDAKNKATRILEDDEVTVIGTFSGVITYESTMGVSITVPSCDADSMMVKGYEVKDTKKNADGQYKVTTATYDDFARNESKYLYERIAFTAKVIQVIEGDEYSQYRMAIDGNNNCIFLVTIDKDTLKIRLLEDDEITATGVYSGLFTYKSTRGGNITVPSCVVSEYVLKGYKESVLSEADADGYYWITSENYEEYARNATAHFLEKVRFTGEVVQLVERKTGANIYRIAVDSNSKCMMYVEYSLPKGATRILEDDIVLLSGDYYGLYTYSTTLGSDVTIPATIASDIDKSYKTLKEGHSGRDVSAMKKRMQELGYFTAGASLSDQFNATCVERVRLFQEVNGLKQTGIADAQTLKLLYSDKAKRNH